MTLGYDLYMERVAVRMADRLFLGDTPDEIKEYLTKTCCWPAEEADTIIGIAKRTLRKKIEAGAYII